MRVQSAGDTAGEVQSGTFSGGAFAVSQTRGRSPVTVLEMRGGGFRICPALEREHAKAAEHRERVLRRLVADSRGRHEIRGKNSMARTRTRRRRARRTALMHTVWTVEERCIGTITRVRRGEVVVTDLATGRRVTLGAGESHLAASGR